MDIGDVVVLSLVQGLTEFIPVSSSGHLLVARLLFGIPDTAGTAFDAFLHLGTLVAVLLYYWRVWVGIARGVIRDDEEGRDKRELFAKIAMATVPAAVAGYFFQSHVTELFRSTQWLAGAFFFTAAVLVFFDVLIVPQQSVRRASYLDAVLIGLAQVVALLPGVSRSGVTIAAGRWRGLPRRQAMQFSFLLSAPIIAGAGLNSLSTLLIDDTFSMPHLFLAFLISFASGYLAISFLFKVVERLSLVPFAIYLFSLGVVLLLYVS